MIINDWIEKPQAGVVVHRLAVFVLKEFNSYADISEIFL
jgi:hypothetical protein